MLTSHNKQVILNCSRQSGKSTIVALLALHHALLNPKVLIPILSPSQRQSGELLRKVIDFYRELGRPLDVFKSDLTFSGAPEYSMQVAQQSAIHALCLVTYDVYLEPPYNPVENVFYHYDRDQLGYRK